ncbi:MAG: arylsulfatase [Acidobacteria bacterium]|nr:arylsulfatase [Acidobacteriota bacterium]
MHRREFLGLTAAGLAPKGAVQAPPNIVFVLTDDLGYGDIACQNPESKIPTPNLDRLAGQGVRFTDAHSPSAVCTPTRYGVLTGRYSWRSRLKSGVLEGYSPSLIEPGRPTVASLLKSRGYYTGGIGKWHLGLGDQEKTDFTRPLHPGPVDHGFDYYFGIPASLDMPPYLYLENDRVVEQATSTTPGKQESGVFWRGGPVAPSFQFDQVLSTLTGKAVRFLRDRAAKPSQPFFLYLALTGPHTPWVPRKEFLGRSKAGIYGDFVCEVDWAAGEILNTLDQAGLSSNTLLIFTSDNGPERYAYERIPEFGHYSMGSLRGVKRDAWEGGHRIPFLARWPGKIRAGGTSNETVCLTDLMATSAALSLAKVPDNGGEDSYNIAPALVGEKRPAPIREATVLHTANGEFAIRQGEWVFIDAKTGMNTKEPEWFRKQRGYTLHSLAGELYNLGQDLAERKNLYAERPDIAGKLKTLLERYKREGRSAPRA